MPGLKTDESETLLYHDDTSTHEDGPADKTVSMRRGGFRRSSTLLVGLLILISLITYYMTQETFISLHNMGLKSEGRRVCHDPYQTPGFSWRSANRTMMRWIPYQEEYIVDEEARISKGKFSMEEIPEHAVSASPPSLSLLMQQPQRASDERLQSLRGRKIVVIGCSLDRNALEMMCASLGTSGENSWHKELHGLSVCYFKDIDLTVEMWFHFGTQTGQIKEVDKYEFEKFVIEKYMPDSREDRRKPDLIVLASGTWDLGYLRTAFAVEDDLQRQDEAAHIPTLHQTPVLPWQGYAYYRTRLRDMVTFLREKMPDTPIMFRRETFMGDTLDRGQASYNAEVLAMRDSATAIMHSLGIPLFTWAEKLIGENDMYDKTHYSIKSAANWLYSDMLLYYGNRAINGEMIC